MSKLDALLLLSAIGLVVLFVLDSLGYIGPPIGAETEDEKEEREWAERNGGQ